MNEKDQKRFKESVATGFRTSSDLKFLLHVMEMYTFTTREILIEMIRKWKNEENSIPF